MYQHILVPTDGSHNAQAAVRKAIDLARTLHATIDIVSVIDERQVMANLQTPVATNVWTDLQQYSESAVASALKQVTDAGMTATTTVYRGNPKQVLVNKAVQQKNADLIMMGRSGTDAIERIFVGSTTAFVVRHATVDVLVVDDDDL